MQVTTGVPLANLPTLMQYLGTNVQGETQQQAVDRAGVVRLMFGQAYATSTSKEMKDVRLIGISPALAQEAIDALNETYILPLPKETQDAALQAMPL